MRVGRKGNTFALESVSVAYVQQEQDEGEREDSNFIPLQANKNC